MNDLLTGRDDRRGDAESWAIFSEDHRYRYVLGRTINAGVDDPKSVAFIGLNPSTADEKHDDPTIRRCKGYAKRWGYDRLIMLNLFAYRATDPADMKAASDPVGEANNVYLGWYARAASRAVCAWGVPGAYLNRGAKVAKMLHGEAVLFALRLTKCGQPSHPLYLPSDLNPFTWEPSL